jgi:5'-nucleotidase
MEPGLVTERPAGLDPEAQVVPAQPKGAAQLELLEHGVHADAAARVAAALVSRLQDSPLDRGLTLNVNIPDLPYEQLRGIRATRLGGRHRSEPAIPVADPRGRRMYWIGPPGEGADAGEGTDFHAVANGYVSVTPLQVDLTRHSALPAIGAWLRPLT